MRTSFIYTVVFFLILVFVSSCKEESPYDLAKENHKLFRCDINGEEWAIMELDYNEDINVYAIRERTGGLILHAKNHPSEEMNEYIYLSINDKMHEGVNKISGGHTVAFIDFAKTPFKKYFIDNDYDNFIEVKYIDSTDIKDHPIVKPVNIIAEFEFRAITNDKQDTILAKNGEFDLNSY